MEEVPFVLDFVERVHTSELAEIEIITSGMFAKDSASCSAVLNDLLRALQRRRDASRVSFTLRLSVDWFHARRIGLSPIVHILKQLRAPEFAAINVYLRSVLIENDSTMSSLAALLGGSLTDIDDYQQWLSLPDGRSILVYYKNLIVDGRLSWQTLKRIGVAPDRRATADLFSRRFLNRNGRHIPARTYNGPRPEILDGVALIVEHDGSVKILEGTAPDRVPCLFERCWDECLDYMYADPVTVFLLEEGPDALAELMLDVNPMATQIAAETNQLYYIVDKLLASPTDRLFAMARILQFHARTGRLAVPSAILGRCRRIVSELATAAAQ